MECQTYCVLFVASWQHILVTSWELPHKQCDMSAVTKINIGKMTEGQQGQMRRAARNGEEKAAKLACENQETEQTNELVVIKNRMRPISKK